MQIKLTKDQLAGENSIILRIFYLHTSSEKRSETQRHSETRELICHFNKGKWVWASRDANHGEAPRKHTGGLMEDPGYLVRSVSANSSQCDENARPFLVWDGKGDIFTKGNVCSACKWVGGRHKTFCIQ